MKTEKLFGQRIACYDNGGKTIDRYTVVYMDQTERVHKCNGRTSFACVAMNHEPFHPLGFGEHSTAMPGKHLGKRIPFATLPDDCRKLVKQDLRPEAGATFTPGPWSIRRYTDPSGVCYQIQIGTREHPKLSACATINKPDATDEANAHLIAAAPDMFAALERIAHRDQIRSGWEAFDTCQLIAKEAIAKARGTEPNIKP